MYMNKNKQYVVSEQDIVNGWLRLAQFDDNTALTYVRR